MFNLHIEFEVATTICNEDTKGNDKCKNSRIELPFGEFRGNAQGSSIILYYAKQAAQKVKKYKYTIRTYKKQRTTT